MAPSRFSSSRQVLIIEELVPTGSMDKTRRRLLMKLDIEVRRNKAVNVVRKWKKDSTLENHTKAELFGRVTVGMKITRWCFVRKQSQYREVFYNIWSYKDISL